MHFIKNKLIRILDKHFQPILLLLEKDAEEVAHFLHQTIKTSFLAVFIGIFIIKCIQNCLFYR